VRRLDARGRPDGREDTKAWFVLAAEPGSRLYAGDRLFEPRAGDCVLLPAGTAHAVVGRVRVAEVRRPGGAADRPAAPVCPVRVEGYPAGAPLWRELVRCRHFHLDYVRQREAFCLPAGRVQVATVLHGEADLTSGAGRGRLVTGDTLLLPATAPVARVVPRGGVGLLLASLPEQAWGEPRPK
jgi:mannose-6-phosphate isomerase